MRTASEMYQYCETNGFGKGMTRKWGIKHFSLVEQALSNDENIHLCFIGLHNYISASKHDGYYAYAITDKRILMAQQKIIGQNLQTVLISNLNDITFKKGMLFGTITIDTLKETFNVGIDSKTAQNINDAIHDLLISLQQGKADSSPQHIHELSSADEIMKYKKLFDDGIITQEEFQQKKSQLLGL